MAKVAKYIPMLLGALLLAMASWVGSAEGTYRELSAQLTQAVSNARAQRWERPVLRGAMRDGNASTEIYNALQDYAPLGDDLKHSLAEKLYFGQPLSADLRRALTMRALSLRALRDSVQQGWSHTDLAVERGQHMLVPDYPKLLEAQLALLGQAQDSEPTACLQQVTDVLRVGQDSIPGAPLEAASVAARVAAFAARVLPRCALKADLTSLRRAAHELRVLATHPAPIGSSLELEVLATAHDFQQRAALVGKSPLQVLDTILDRSQLMASWQSYLHPERLRAVLSERYPEALEVWKREHDAMAQVHPQPPAIEAHLIARLTDDMRAQAIVRMLCVAVTALAERVYKGTTPTDPAALHEPELADPYQGQPLHYGVSKNGAELALWAVGPDMRDDGGSEEWSDSGPRDISVHVALR